MPPGLFGKRFRRSAHIDRHRPTGAHGHRGALFTIDFALLPCRPSLKSSSVRARNHIVPGTRCGGSSVRGQGQPSTSLSSRGRTPEPHRSHRPARSDADPTSAVASVCRPTVRPTAFPSRPRPDGTPLLPDQGPEVVDVRSGGARPSCPLGSNSSENSFVAAILRPEAMLDSSGPGQDTLHHGGSRNPMPGRSPLGMVSSALRSNIHPAWGNDNQRASTYPCCCCPADTEKRRRAPTDRRPCPVTSRQAATRGPCSA